jgi:ketosteroid isomerase-like protein
MKRTNIEFMIGWLDALRRGDRESLRAMLDPAIVWQGLRDEWSCSGAGAVVDRFAGERRARAQVEAIELIGAERHVILHASGPGVVAIEDIPLRDGIYNVFTIEDGKVTRIDDFADRARALAAAGVSPARVA